MSLVHTLDVRPSWADRSMPSSPTSTPLAAKTGALGTVAIIEAVAARKLGTRDFPLVVDPVMIGKHGAALIDAQARTALRELLIPRAAIVTPNLPEAAELAGLPVHNIDQMKEAALRIADLGARAVLIKGGHLEGPDFEGETVDILLHEGVFTEFRAARIHTRHTHAETGCTYSAAITARFSPAVSPYPTRWRAPNASSTRLFAPIPASAQERVRSIIGPGPETVRYNLFSPQ